MTAKWIFKMIVCIILVASICKPIFAASTSKTITILSNPSKSTRFHISPGQFSIFHQPNARRWFMSDNAGIVFTTKLLNTESNLAAELKIFDSEGNIIAYTSGKLIEDESVFQTTSILDVDIYWNGYKSNGKRPPSGIYTASFSLQENNDEIKPVSFYLDNDDRHCGTGVGLAIIIPIMIMPFLKRKKRKKEYILLSFFIALIAKVSITECKNRMSLAMNCNSSYQATIVGSKIDNSKTENSNRSSFLVGADILPGIQIENQIYSLRLSYFYSTSFHSELYKSVFMTGICFTHYLSKQPTIYSDIGGGLSFSIAGNYAETAFLSEYLSIGIGKLISQNLRLGSFVQFSFGYKSNSFKTSALDPNGLAIYTDNFKVSETRFGINPSLYIGYLF